MQMRKQCDRGDDEIACNPGRLMQSIFKLNASILLMFERNRNSLIIIHSIKAI